MTTRQPKNASNNESISHLKGDGREERLASALRRNLLKRKGQKQARAAEKEAGDVSGC